MRPAATLAAREPVSAVLRKRLPCPSYNRAPFLTCFSEAQPFPGAAMSDALAVLLQYLIPEQAYDRAGRQFARAEAGAATRAFIRWLCQSLPGEHGRGGQP